MSSDEPSIRTLYIKHQNLSLTISDDLLRRAGDYFNAMLNPKYGFNESTGMTIQIDFLLHSDLTAEHWEQYFKLVESDYSTDQIAQLSLSQIYYLLLIAQYLQNLKLMKTFENYLDQQISKESLISYLPNWMSYYQCYSLYDDVRKTEALIKHLEHRLLEIVDDYQLAFKRGLISFFQNLKQTYSNQEDPFFQIYQIWWRSAKPAVFQLLSDYRLKLSKYFDNLFLFDPSGLKVNQRLISNYYQKNCIIYQQVFVKNQNAEQLKNMMTRDEIFPNKWQKLTLGLLDGIDWSNLFLAGGSVNKLLNPKFDQFPVNTDLDLFLMGDPEQQQIKLNQLISWFLDKYDGQKIYFGIHRSVINLWVEDLPRMIQIVSSNTRSIFETLCRFDLTHCQLAYDGTNFQATTAALITLQTGISEQQNMIDINSNYYRLFKAQQVGYHLVLDGKVAAKFAQLDENQLNKFKNNYNYNYYFPSSQISVEKNEFELRKHYHLTDLYVGPSIFSSLREFKFNTEFRRGYQQQDRSKEKSIVSIDKKDNYQEDKKNKLFDAEQVIISKLKTSYSNIAIHKIYYDNSPLVIKLPVMPLVFVNDKSKSSSVGSKYDINQRFIVLEISPKIKDQLEKIAKTIYEKFLADRSSLFQFIERKKYLSMTDQEIIKNIAYSFISSSIMDDAEEERLSNLKISVETPFTKIYDWTDLMIGKNEITTAKQLDQFNKMRSRVQVTLILPHVWVGNGRFGIKKIASKINIYSSIDEYQKILVLEDSVEDKDPETNYDSTDEKEVDYDQLIKKSSNDIEEKPFDIDDYI